MAVARLLSALSVSLSFSLFATHAWSAPTDVRCHAGAYRLDDGAVVDVATVSEPNQLRWRLLDGRTGLLTFDDKGQWTSTLGWTGRADGVRVDFGDCSAADRIEFDGKRGARIAFDIIPTTFQGNGVTLRGRLVLPKGNGRVPVMVTVHGSENYSGVDRYHMQNLFPAYGIGVFVYDKRGTGGSSGKYTQDFYLLSDDAKAAVLEARRLAGKRAGRVGLSGGSQGGWVAPLTATKTPVDFVSVGFGMAEGPLAEDREQVMLDLRNAGYGDDVQAKAREVTDATGVIVASRGARGWEQMDAVRAKYGQAPWWNAMKGEFTGLVVQHTREQLEKMAPELEQGTTWDYDPMPVLRAVKAPQLWMIAGDDLEAPPQETRKRLAALAAEGRPMTAYEFPHTDHGIIAFEIDAKGERKSTRVADGYYRMQIDWISTGKLPNAPYGDAQLLASPKPVAAR